MHYELPDFDTLVEMAENDPQGLEALRVKLSNQVIDAAPARMQNRLRGLQFQIDAQRQLAKSPLAACIKFSEMMHESLVSLREVLNTLTNAEAINGYLESMPAESEELVSARVLPFQSQRF